MTKRHYEPAVYVHEATCEDAPNQAIVYSPLAVAGAYPTARPHTCFSRATITMGRKVVIEHVVYEPHRYEAATIYPVDAIRPLCTVCRGTHSDVELNIPKPPLLGIVPRHREDQP